MVAWRARRLVAESLRGSLRGRQECPHRIEATLEQPAAELPAGLGTLGKEYIRAAIEELKPLLHECYDAALSTTPDLGGRLVVTFDVLGAPEVGGVVDAVAPDPASSVSNPDLEECVRETMYVARLPSPSAGGSVHVEYPFLFERRESDETVP